MFKPLFFSAMLIFRQRSLFVLFFLAVVFVFCTIPVLAAEEIVPTVNWLHMSMMLFGGLALFLFGMEQMSDALKSALGDQMKVLLAKLTRNRFTGALTGAFVTAVIQSSSVTTVLAVGFVSAGMMTMSQSIGVIMGANVGTTITAQIVAFKVEEAALWMIAFGFFMMFVGKQERIKHYGSMLMGLGLIFYGMSLMGEAMKPLRSYEPFLQLMVQMSNPVLAILAGAIFTALVQSSSATTAIVITMAGQGLISLEAGITLAMGANIGTCVTAQLAALGKSREALQAAVVHLLFNVLGVLIWLPFISHLGVWVTDISPSHPELEGTARLIAEVPRQIANAHTLFNIINLFIFIGFTTQLARLVDRLVPAKSEPETRIITPQYLDETMVQTPAIAMQMVRLEIARMGELVREMFSGFRESMLTRQRDKLINVQEKDDQVDALESEIFLFLSKIRRHELTEQENNDFALAMKVADNLESVGDIIESNLTPLGFRVLDNNIQISSTMEHIFSDLGDKLSVALDATVQAIREDDQNAANQVFILKEDIDYLINQALEIQSNALADNDPEQIELIRMEMTALENFKRIHTYLKRIAREIVPPALRN